MYGVLSAILKSQDFKAILKTHVRRGDDRVVYFRVLEKLETTFYGDVGIAVCLYDLTNRSVGGKADHVIMFDEVSTIAWPLILSLQR